MKRINTLRQLANWIEKATGRVCRKSMNVITIYGDVPPPVRKAVQNWAKRHDQRVTDSAKDGMLLYRFVPVTMATTSTD